MDQLIDTDHSTHAPIYIIQSLEQSMDIIQSLEQNADILMISVLIYSYMVYNHKHFVKV